MPNKLVIFDIDGTLTKTNHADHRSYIAAVRHLIQPDFSEFDPEAYTHFTDSNIVNELYQWNTGKLPSHRDLAAFKRFYLQDLCAQFGRIPEAFEAVEGANDILHSLPADWQVALATGCWQESAMLKLSFSGVYADEIPRGTASDALSRADIMRKAIERATPFLEGERWERIVYVGDGIWDLRTCAAMGIPFIGIEAEENVEKQQKLGAHWLLTGYGSVSDFVQLLETAEVPR